MSTKPVGRHPWRKTRAKYTFAWEAPKLTNITADASADVLLDSDGLYKKRKVVTTFQEVEEELFKDAADYALVQQLLISANPILREMRARRNVIEELFGSETIRHIRDANKALGTQFESAINDSLDVTLPWPPFSAASTEHRKRLLSQSIDELTEATEQALDDVIEKMRVPKKARTQAAAESDRSQCSESNKITGPRVQRMVRGHPIRHPLPKEEAAADGVPISLTLIQNLEAPRIIKSEVDERELRQSRTKVLVENAVVQATGLSPKEWAMMEFMERNMDRIPLPNYMPDYLSPYEDPYKQAARDRFLPLPESFPAVQSALETGEWTDVTRQFLLAAQERLNNPTSAYNLFAYETPRGR
eukprot:Gregarina_sp_Poly_1__10517@NODE_773_length_6343_cov_143_248247_g568_i0_p2_GENE_NODE_773_length_6343_cov_143_248247_g568_i0NODE_773_length_6343_cov_143_248247_g568_i0_p2_ORF_typecomplete_len360_score53_50_NODE_773_length_6343_cov_143_248247_g568_i047975876